MFKNLFYSIGVVVVVVKCVRLYDKITSFAKEYRKREDAGTAV